MWKRWMVLFLLSSICILPLHGESSAIDKHHLDPYTLSEYRAEKGLRNLEPHSIVLMEEGLSALEKGRDKEAITYFKDARDLSPDLPLPYLYLAGIYLSFSMERLSMVVEHLLGAWKAFLNNFWWSFWMAGTAFVSLYLALYTSIVILFIVLIASRVDLYIHDVVEDRRKILLIIPPLVLVLFGPILGLFALMLPLWVYYHKREKTLLYTLLAVTALIVLTVPYLSSLLESSGDVNLKEIINVNQGIYTGNSFRPLKRDDSPEAAFTHALRLKREGNYREAIKVYKGLLGREGMEARVYNNMANCYVGLNDYDTALTYYYKALRLAKLASTYYNLSQLKRESFNFDDAMEYYREAMRISPEEVSFYTAIRGTSLNRFVMDEVLSNGELWLLAFKRIPPGSSSLRLEDLLSFTSRWIALPLLLLIGMVLAVYDKKVSVRAYRCQRCGRIRCSHCEKRLSRDEVCLLCYKTLVQTVGLSPKERIERIIEIHHYRDKKFLKLKIMTLLLPGSGHIYYGWPISGFSIMLLFTFFLFSALIWNFSAPPLAMTRVASIFKGLSITGLAFVYIFTVIKVFRRIPKRWR